MKIKTTTIAQKIEGIILKTILFLLGLGVIGLLLVMLKIIWFLLFNIALPK